MEAAIQALEAARVAHGGLAAYGEMGPASKQRVRRRQWAQRALQAIFGDDESHVASLAGKKLQVRGGVFTQPLDGWGDMDATEVQAARVWRFGRQHSLSLRALHKTPRSCTHADLVSMRGRLQMFSARPVEVSSSLVRKKAGAIVRLRKIILAHIAVAEKLGGVVLSPRARIDRKIWVILCADATPLWKSSATRCDVYVDIWGPPSCASQAGRWSTWWAVDGGDDAHTLRMMDWHAQLNAQVVDVLGMTCAVGWGGGLYHFDVYITGDGKMMRASNHATGKACGLCQQGESLDEQPDIPLIPRFGSYLRAVPCSHRVGDYVHGACRIVNAVFKRCQTVCSGLGYRGQAPARELRLLVSEITHEAAQIPVAERLAPRKTKLGAFDLTTARIFLEGPAYRRRVVSVLQEHLGDVEVAGTLLWVGVNSILSTLAYMHSIWRTKDFYTDAQVALYRSAARKFSKDWQHLQWKFTPWTHWLCAHSAFFVATHRNMFIFSSIPTEYKNKAFKRDLSHCFRGWSLSRPYYTKRGLTHVVNMSGVDLGLVLLEAGGGQGEGAFARAKRKRPAPPAEAS